MGATSNNYPAAIPVNGAALDQLGSDPAAQSSNRAAAIAAIDSWSDSPSSDGAAVGAALTVVNDPMASRIAGGGEIRINSQEEWDALPPAQKEYLRAMKAAGGVMRASDALRAYQTAVRAEESKRATLVPLPGGGSVVMVGNTMVPREKNTPVQMDRVVDESGIVRMVDPTSGASFPAWDKNTGEPVRAQRKMTDSERSNMEMWQQKLDSSVARVEALKDWTDDSRVMKDGNTGKYVPSWFGSKVSSLREKEIANMQEYERKLGGARPEVENRNGGYGSPQDVAAAFQAGKIDRAAAKKILNERFQIK